MITLHWSLLIFIPLVMLILYGLYSNSRTRGNYDFGTPIVFILLLAALVIVVVIYGGIFWW